MSVFGSIFGKKGFGKGSHGVAMFFTAGAHSPRPRPGRSAQLETVSPMAAQSETEHHIGGAHPRAPSPRRWETPSGMSPQTGRSMIEMLGVLAIVGVLVAGAVAAYTFAVAKNRANSIYRQVDLRAVASVGNPVVRQTLSGQEYTLLGFDETIGNITYRHQKTNAAGFDIIVSSVPKRVCRRLQDMAFPLPKTVQLNGQDLSSGCGAENEFIFSFEGMAVGRPSSAERVDCNCSGCQSCESGTCQDNDNLCGPKEICVSGTCQCAAGFSECQGACYSNCAAGFVRDPVSCDCVCEEQTCPEYALWDAASCSCKCDTDLGFSADLKDGQCVCPAGSVLLDGQCQTFGCTGGTKGSRNWTCEINGRRCGSSCSENGTDCEYGYCSAALCPSSQLRYVAAQDLYGCYNPALTTTCVRRSTTFTCFLNETVCGYVCDVNGESCYYGECFDDNCRAAGLAYGHSGVDGLGNGCRVQEDVTCVKDGATTNITCAKDGTICAVNCKTRDGQNCAYNTCLTACSEGQIEQTNDDGTTSCVDFCPAGTTYLEEDRYAGCLNADGIYCYMTSGSMTVGIECSLYPRTGSNSCATRRCQLDGTGCEIGTCEEQECRDLGMTWVKTPYYYGCYNPATDVSCTKVTSWYRCFQGNTQRCGADQACTSYYADGCPECLTDFECPTGGTLVVKNWGNKYCQYANGVECRYDTGECTYHNAVCGQGCEIDGTDCATGMCVCPNGQEPVAGETLMTCQDLGDLTCSGGVCQIGLNPCGTGCDAQGNCSVGVCKAQDCGDLVLQKASYQFYGCYDQTQGTVCYPNGSTYSCWKNGSLCGDGCTINGTGGTCDTGCV